MTSPTSTPTVALGALGTTATLRTAASALIAAALGVFILYSVGFANSATLHNAAHDTRHSMVFPCH